MTTGTHASIAWGERNRTIASRVMASRSKGKNLADGVTGDVSCFPTSFLTWDHVFFCELEGDFRVRSAGTYGKRTPIRRAFPTGSPRGGCEHTESLVTC